MGCVQYNVRPLFHSTSPTGAADSLQGRSTVLGRHAARALPATSSCHVQATKLPQSAEGWGGPHCTV